MPAAQGPPLGTSTMDTGRTDILSRHRVPRHRLTLDEYHRLGEAGILGEDDRVELLEGQLVDMSPIGPRHALAVDALTELLVVAVAGRAGVRVQNPIELDDATEPQPDIVLVRRPCAATDLASAARRHLPGDRGGGHKPGDRSRGQAGTVRQGGDFGVLDCGPDDGWRVGRPKSRRWQIWVYDEGRALGHSGCGRSARVADTGSFAVRVVWRRLPACRIVVSDNR